MPAAHAAVCAGEQGRFEEIHDLLYEKQDSLGLKPFESYAAESGVRSISAFRRCLESGRADSVIAKDTAAARLAAGFGTPTVIVDGLRLGNPPDSARLFDLVREVLEAR